MKKIIYHPIVVWGISIIVFLIFLWAGMIKLLSSTESFSALWSAWGIPKIIVYIVGFLEIAGALTILRPRFAAISALALSVLMLIAATLCFKNDAPGYGWFALYTGILSLILSMLRRRDLYYKNQEAI